MKAAIYLTVPPSIERQFKKLAKAMFPCEAYALFLGTIAGDRVHVDEMYVPENLSRFSKPEYVTIQPEWVIDANEQAKESDLVITCDAHSHTYRKGETVFDAVQSEKDLQRDCGMAAYGVCNVVETKRGLRASLRWYGPQIGLVKVQ
jgi:proteasome lid subunit RPN8/RPN11